MAVAGVEEHARHPSCAHHGHHVRHHRPQPGPGHDLGRFDAGEVAAHPVDQRLHAVGADVAVEVVEFGGACDAEAIGAEPAGDDLGGRVEQAHGGRRIAACGSVELHGDRVALYRIDVDPLIEEGGEVTAGHAGADHDTVHLQHAARGRDSVGCGKISPADDEAAACLGNGI